MEGKILFSYIARLSSQVYFGGLHSDFGSDEETDVDVFVELTRRIYIYKEAVFFALSLFRMVENIFDFSHDTSLACGLCRRVLPLRS